MAGALGAADNPFVGKWKVNKHSFTRTFSLPF